MLLKSFVIPCGPPLIPGPGWKSQTCFPTLQAHAAAAAVVQQPLQARPSSLPRRHTPHASSSSSVAAAPAASAEDSDATSTGSRSGRIKTSFRGGTRPSGRLAQRLQRTEHVMLLLSRHMREARPRQVVTSLCHMVDLVQHQGQSLSPASQRQLTRLISHLVEPQPAGPEGLKVVQQSQQQPEQTSQQQPESQQQQQPEQQQQQQQPEQQQQQQAAASPSSGEAPLARFSPRDLSSLLWALAQLHVPQALLPRHWPPLLDAITSATGRFSPRHASRLAWALVQLQAVLPLGWSQQLLDSQAAALPSYPVQSAVLLLHSAVRLRSRLPGSCHGPLLAALAPELRRMSSQQLAMLLWSLSLLRVAPPAPFMQAATAASARHLSGASCAELSALMSAMGRLGYVPPGRWLLELFDQLYWTADQLELRQLSQLVWALGRLQLGAAVPQELLERLLTFAGSEASTALAAPPGGTAAAAAAGARAANQLSKQLSAMLVGLASLRPELTTRQRSDCCHWLVAAMGLADGSSSSSSLLLDSRSRAAAARRVPAVLRAAVLLQLPLSPEQCRHILLLLQQLQPDMNHMSLALGSWAAVQLGCQPGQLWLQQCLAASQPLLPLAAYGELNMLLTVCAQLRQPPPDAWLVAALQRMAALVGAASGRDISASLRWLVLLGVGPALLPPRLLPAMTARMEQLEVASRVSQVSQQHFQQALMLMRLRQTGVQAAPVPLPPSAAETLASSSC